MVDHHSGFRQDLAAYLAGLDRGYEVVAQAGTAAEALAQAARLAPDLALVDVDLPGDNGLVATRLLRRARPATAVIVVGDDPAAEYERAALAAGASAYVDKLELVQALPAALAAVARPAAPQAQGAPYEAAGDAPPRGAGRGAGAPLRGRRRPPRSRAAQRLAVPASAGGARVPAGPVHPAAGPARRCGPWGAAAGDRPAAGAPRHRGGGGAPAGAGMARGALSGAGAAAD